MLSVSCIMCIYGTDSRTNTTLANTVASYSHTATLSGVTVYGAWYGGWGCSRRERARLRKTKAKMNGKSSNGWRKLETLLARYAASFPISLACLAPFLCECRIAQAIGFRLQGYGGTRWH